MAYEILAAGLVLILLGSEAALRGGVGLARLFNIDPLWTGVLVIATATSLPELFVAMRAATMNAPGIALGGLIGTNILNVLFVMGLGALLHPMASPPKVVFRDGGALILASLMMILAALDGAVGRKTAVLLIAGFAAYVAVIVITDWRRSAEHSVPLARALYRSQGELPSFFGALFFFLVGLTMLALGAHFSVLGSIAFARRWGWEETAVGLTIVAAGLSLPKLAWTLTAAARRQTTTAVGLLIGAGVFNLTLVLGLTALAVPLVVPHMLAHTDVYVMAAASAALVPLLALRWRLSRPRGIVLMIGYGCYLAFVLWRQGLLPQLPLPGLG